MPILDERLPISTPIITRAIEILAITYTRDNLENDLYDPIDCVITPEEIIKVSSVTLEQHLDDKELLVVLNTEYSLEEGSFQVIIEAIETYLDEDTVKWDILWVISCFEEDPLTLYANDRLQNLNHTNSDPNWTDEEKALLEAHKVKEAQKN